jgi:hypothetical protein
LQGPQWHSEGASGLAEQQLLPLQSLLFDDHFGDAFQRVQRVRAKKVTAWMEKPECLPVLISSSLVFSPLERLMPGPWQPLHLCSAVNPLFGIPHYFAVLYQ